MRAKQAARAAAVAALLAAVSLAGCGHAGPAPAPAGATAPATSPPSAAPTTPPSSEHLLRVTRSGGFAGRTRTLLVNGDGSWTLLGERDKELRTGRLDAARLEDLRTALRAADFAHLPPTTAADPPVYDGFRYSFVHGGSEVSADGTVLPPALSRVLEALPGFDAA